MAHKTFISYKYSESVALRDKIIEAMGKDAIYYNGENGFSPNKSDDTDDAIWNYLKDMIWPTSVTIVILSPNMRQSSWIPDEIAYSLRKVKRGETTSQRNGLVAVIQKVNDSYDWLLKHNTNCHGTATVSYKNELLPDIIAANHFNSEPPIVHCDKCKTYDSELGSYISYVQEDTFLADVNGYVEKAFQKSQDDGAGYNIRIEDV